MKLWKTETYGRTYEDTGFKMRVIRSLIKKEKPDVTITKIPTLYFYINSNDLDTPTQYAVVWNNGIAGSLVDSISLIVNPIFVML